jgi:ferredoxin-thioredoxin reductase catalytic subunit
MSRRQTAIDRAINRAIERLDYRIAAMQEVRAELLAGLAEREQSQPPAAKPTTARKPRTLAAVAAADGT